MGRFHEKFLHKRVMDQIDISSEDLEDGEVPDSDEDITIINIVPLEKSKILSQRRKRTNDFEKDRQKYRKRSKRSRSSSTSSSSSSDSSTSSRLVIQEKQPAKKVKKNVGNSSRT